MIETRMLLTTYERFDSQSCYKEENILNPFKNTSEIKLKKCAHRMVLKYLINYVSSHTLHVFRGTIRQAD